jgi:hypothetical protein
MDVWLWFWLTFAACGLYGQFLVDVLFPRKPKVPDTWRDPSLLLTKEN